LTRFLTRIAQQTLNEPPPLACSWNALGCDTTPCGTRACG
jgi:hypothetical protein